MVARHLSTIGRVLVLQSLVVILIVSFFGVVQGKRFAVDAFLGGMAAFMPNAYFAFKVKRAQGLHAKKIVNSFYIGESGKLILTAVIFALIFQLPNVKILPLMTSYVAVLSTFWFALIMRE